MLSDDEIDGDWLSRTDIHNGELMPQLRDFARAIERTARDAERERIAKHFDEWDFIDTAKTIRALQEGS